jgi:hypothetical protein
MKLLEWILVEIFAIASYSARRGRKHCGLSEVTHVAALDEVGGPGRKGFWGGKCALWIYELCGLNTRSQF